MSREIRILAVIPIVHTEDVVNALEERRKMAEKINQQTRGLVELDFVLLDRGAASIEDAYDEAISVPFILQKVKKAEEDGYNAVVIDCFLDSGLDAARELVKIPVLGANEAASHLAAQLAPKFSVISIVPDVEHLIRNLLTKYGLIQNLASIRTIDMPALTLMEDPAKSIGAITQATEKAVKEDGAYAIVLGCTGMLSLVEGVKNQLEAKGLKIPVIDPLRAAIFTSVARVLMGVSHSKEAYRPPRPKLRRIT